MEPKEPHECRTFVYKARILMDTFDAVRLTSIYSNSKEHGGTIKGRGCRLVKTELNSVLLLSFVFALVAGCATMVSMDRSELNHPAMDLSSPSLPAQPHHLTNLGTLKQSGSGGACSVCAH